MACPYFYPLEQASGGRQPARAPLGIVYTGRCELGGTGDQEACNFGYARQSCEAFPKDAEVDAVRFTTLAGSVIFILERNYMPVRHGDVGMLEGALARQAEVFRQCPTR